MNIFVILAIIWVSKCYADLKCTKNPLDLVFVIDSSSSIFPNEFVRQLEFLENITGALDVGPSDDQSRVGVISFSDEPRLEFPLNQYTEKAALVTAIRRINYLSGGTNTAAAIQLAADSMFKMENGARAKAKDIIIVITDGESFSESETKTSAQKAREMGIVMFAIGVGISVNVNELHLITGVTEHVYQVSKYGDLKTITEALINKTCIETQVTTSRPITQYDVPQNETIHESCGGKPANVLFLLDSSSSIHRNDFKKQVNFVKTIVSAFDIGPDKTNVGVYTFSDSFHSVFQLNEFMTKENILKAIDHVPYLRGGTDTGNALKIIREFGFTMERPNVAHILIVITDGLSRDPTETLFQAKLLKESGVKIFAIGVGPFTDKKELRYMASSPKEDLEFNFNVFTFDTLNTIEKVLAKRTCEVAGQQMEDFPRCDLSNPMDILFVFDFASIGYQGSEIILNITQRFKELQFPTGADVKVGVISESCDVNADISFQSVHDNFTMPSDKFVPLVKKAMTFGLSAENGARSYADQIVVLLVDKRLTKADEHEILEMETKVDKLYLIYLGGNHNTETLLTVSPSTFFMTNITNNELSSVLLQQLCGIDMRL